MKKLISAMAAVSLIFGTLPCFAAESEVVEGVDVRIEKVYLSNMNYNVGDVVSIYADVKNYGNVPTSQTSVYALNMSGCVSSTNTNVAYLWSQTAVDSYGGEKTIALTPITITDEHVSFDFLYDFETDINRENNKMHFECDSLRDKTDLEIEKIITSPDNFSVGDDIDISLVIKNNGLKSVEDGIITCTVRAGNKRISKRITADIEGEEKQTFEMGTISAPSDDFEITAQIALTGDAVASNNKLVARKISYANGERYDYKRIAQASGGFIPGFHIDPKLGDVYAETDVGGFYRLNRDTNKFEDMTITLDSDANCVLGVQTIYGRRDVMFYAAAGGVMDVRGYADSSGVFRTRDGGNTWEDLNFPTRLASHIKFHNPIALDQNNPNKLYVVSVNGQAYKTENALDDIVKWEKIILPGCLVKWLVGGQPISDSLTSALVDSAVASKVFIASAPDGIYISSDEGKTFSLSPGSPKNVTNMAADGRGNVYAVAFEDNGSLWKYDGSAWKKIYSVSDTAMRNVRVSPHNSNIIAFTTDTNIYLSTNGGSTFRNISRWSTYKNSSEFNRVSPLWQYMGGLEFDPVNPKGLWFGDFYSVFKTDDFTALSVYFEGIGEGLEELCLEGVMAYNTADRLATVTMDGNICIKDAAGYYDRWNTNACHSVKKITTSLTMDYCRDNPNFSVFFGGTSWEQSPSNGGYTTDGGKTWTAFDNSLVDSEGNALAFFHCAVSKGIGDSGNPTIVGVTSGRGLYRSDDLGATWEKVSIDDGGSYAWGGALQICCDPNKDKTFYFYSMSSGKFYKSTDDGKTFNNICNLPHVSQAYMRPFETNNGYVALALNKAGLYISKTEGKRFVKAKGVTDAKLVGIGKRAVGSDYDTIFIYGSVGSKEGFFKSVDCGETWSYIDSDYKNHNVIKSIDGDKFREGVLYSATSGRGLIELCPSENSKAAVESDSDEITAVKITYKSKKSEKSRKINFSCGDDKYSVKYPVLDATEQTAVFDIALKKGTNYIYADEGVEILSAERFDGNTRRYSGTEFAKVNQMMGERAAGQCLLGRGNKLDKVYEAEDKSIEIGIMLDFYVPESGVYKIDAEVATEYWKTCLLYFNGKRITDIGCEYDYDSENPSNSKVVFADGSAMIYAERGFNSICIANSNYDAQVYVNYIDVTKLDVNKATVSEDNGEMAASAVLFNSSEKKANVALLLAQYDEEGRLLDVQMVEKPLETNAFEAVSVIAEILPKSTNKVFIFNMDNLKPLM